MSARAPPAAEADMQNLIRAASAAAPMPPGSAVLLLSSGIWETET